MDVFNHSFWKLYIKIINDLDPGLNLPEIVMYTLITKIWDKLGDKTGRSTLEIRLFITFQREESKKIQTYSIYMHIT